MPDTPMTPTQLKALLAQMGGIDAAKATLDLVHAQEVADRERTKIAAMTKPQLTPEQWEALKVSYRDGEGGSDYHVTVEAAERKMEADDQDAFWDAAFFTLKKVRNSLRYLIDQLEAEFRNARSQREAEEAANAALAADAATTDNQA